MLLLCGTEILMIRDATSCHLPVTSPVKSWIFLLVPSVGYSHSRHPCDMNGHVTISGPCQNFCTRVHLAHWSTQLATPWGVWQGGIKGFLSCKLLSHVYTQNFVTGISVTIKYEFYLVFFGIRTCD
jgi:hypothetical protein